jgi:glycosyltransferase involved in cell wall biosynthesis
MLIFHRENHALVRVSVVICTYTEGVYEHFQEAVESVIQQTYDNLELVLVSDGNEPVYQRMLDDYGDREDTIVSRTEENIGISAARNHGIDQATGDVVAQIDDDAIADPKWVEELVCVYESTDAIAVGGKMTPEWLAGKPNFLPEEFYWLIGVTHKGFAEPGEEVRNTFGSNISFRREVITELGGFDPNVGRKGDAEIQAHESELCTRLRQQFGRGVVYNPDAKVAHKVFDYRTEPRWLIGRAFWQGYSKRALETLLPDASRAEESAFLSFLLSDSVPLRVRQFLSSPSVVPISQLVWLMLLTGLVGLGYLYGIIKWR